MQISDEMLKRAIEAYAKDTGAEDWQLEGWIEPAIRAALEAALSAAEPVDYQLVFSDGRTSRVLYSKDEAERFKKASDITVDIRPLYAALPTPSVAVKEHGKVRERMICDIKGLIEFLSENPDNIYHLDAGKVSELRSALSKDAEPVTSGKAAELDGVPDALAYGKGVWRTCTGCHESNEGYPTGPFSDTLKCHLGGGCFECGGIGAVWDTTDYEDMGNFIALSAQVQDVAGTVAAFERDYPELYWHIAKGKITAGEPLYGAIVTDLRGTELGHGESDVSAVDAFNIAVSAAAPAKQEGKP